ncbi:PH domain-containing protein [Alteromonas gilva]|uniref:PH domain-containing protein n=1 Tax=Alteromonas gilva TaxID=2987522 RepID=A0ABT5L4S7_9ALTE|nr:PH domain-containing protein [Alteromonas gilva]MDC8830768.1 PH domain-containing protein [Alteromonas gilva]
MAEKILRSASFDPKVKTYWMISLLIISGATVIGIPLLIISIPVFLFICGKMLAAMSATLTERKLVVKRGIWFTEEKSIPLDKITDVSMSQGPLMKLFGLYRLAFETAGQSSQGALVSLVGIVDAADFREAILDQKENVTSRNNPPSEKPDTPPSDLQALTQSVQRIEAMLADIIQSKNK